MEIRLLRYFLAAAREENITRAAESLHISQPSLSKQLMELERELGKPLLIRGGRKLALTEDGVLLRRRAEEILALLDKTERELTADRAALSGSIAIGGMPTHAILHTAAALRAENPGLRFDFFSGDATDVCEQLDHGSLDFAVLLQPVDTLKYKFLPLHDSSRWGVLMPDSDALAAHPVIDRQTLCRLPLITHRRPGLQREIEHWAQTDFAQLNIAATYNIAAGDPAVFVRSGLGYFLTTENHLSEQLDAGLRFCPLDPPLEIHHALVWKRHALLSKAAQAFLDACKKRP